MIIPPINGWQYDPNQWYTVVIPVWALFGSNAPMSINPSTIARDIVLRTGSSLQIFIDDMWWVGGLEFPLKGTGDGAYTTRIQAVLDHSRHADKAMRDKQCSNGTVTAYTGEEGVRGSGTVAGVDYSVWPNPKTEPSCGGVVLRGLPQAGFAQFYLGGQYDRSVGTETDNPPGNEGGRFLFYDGHSGFDYPKPNGTLVHAVAHGVAYDYTYPGILAGEYPIRVDHENGYESFYLHLSERLVSNGTRVSAGQKIGRVGAGHLHLHLRLHGELVDPYGWTSPMTDPLRTYVVSIPLWKLTQ